MPGSPGSFAGLLPKPELDTYLDRELAVDRVLLVERAQASSPESDAARYARQRHRGRDSLDSP